MPSKSELELLVTPGGNQVYLFNNESSQETEEEGDRVLSALLPDGELFGKPLIFTVKLMNQKVPPSLKGRLKELSEGIGKNKAPISVVCLNPVLRFAVKALCILAPHGGPLKVVDSVPSALAWFDTVMKKVGE
jgi:hypothetical protein